MELICNSRNGVSKLEAIHKSAIIDAEKVEAAVAYISEERPFLETCWNEKKPLLLYGRYDHTGPISPGVIDWFLSKQKQSANYALRLVPDIFHPKVIWWRGVGVYIGSANLSNRAWYGNFEAGVYLTEDELDDNDMREELEQLFADVRAASQPLTQEIADEMKRMASKVFGPEDGKIRREFQKTRQILELPSLISVTRIPSKQKNKAKFIQEWNQTLQLLRDISERLVIKQNLPSWIDPSTPKGVLADQFLHAYYYNEVRDGSSYPYRELNTKYKSNPEAALSSAILWWSKLKSAPSNEDIHINDWAPEVRVRLANGIVSRMPEEDFVEVCIRVHAVRDHAARMGHKAFGLEHRLHKMDKDDRVKYFAHWLYKQRSLKGTTPCELIDFVLFGGPLTETPDRLFEACSNSDKKIPHIGISTLGEMVGWAMPDDFPPRMHSRPKAAIERFFLKIPQPPPQLSKTAPRLASAS